MSMFIRRRLLLSSRASALLLVGALGLTTLSISPANADINDDAKQLNNEGVLALNHNDYQLAIEKLHGALELLSTYRTAKVNLAVAYNNQGLSIKDKPTDAIQYFHKAVFLDPDNLTSVTNLTGIIQRMGKNPDDSDTRVALGDSSKSSGDNIGAIVEYSEALKLKNQSAVRDKLLQTLTDFEGNSKPSQIAIYRNALKQAHAFASTSNSLASGGSAANVANAVNFADSASSVNNAPANGSTDSVVSNKATSSPPAGPLTTYCDAIQQKILSDHMDSITWNGYVMVDAEVDKDGKITTATINTLSQGTPDEKASAVQFIKSLNFVGIPPASLARTLKLSFTLCKSVKYLSVSVTDTDFSNYMVELQKKIKSNWYPPKENSTLKSEVYFRLYRDGTFKGLKFLHSTGNADADAAAFAAVKAASPFAPLLDGSPQYVDVAFKFDYNVFNKGKLVTSKGSSGASTANAAGGSYGSGTNNGGSSSAISGASGKVDIKNKEAANAISGADQCFAQGMTALGQKDYPLAIQFMESAIALDPQNASAKKTLSIAYTSYAKTFLGSKPDLAMENFRKAKKSWPDNPMVPETIEQANSMFGAGADSKPKDDSVKP